MQYQDKTLTCRDCQKEFVWTAGEQQFFAEKGFDKPPIRCPDCRKKKKAKQQNLPKNIGERAIHKIVCSKCSKESEVDFQPRNPRGILCAECFEEKIKTKQE